MTRIIFSVVCFFSLTSFSFFADEIDYGNCQSIQDVIERETQEITRSSLDSHELAQLYVSRGESYLLAAQFEKAVVDFQNARLYIEDSLNSETATIVVFRAAFGEVVCYDNLGMEEIHYNLSSNFK